MYSQQKWRQERAVLVKILLLLSRFLPSALIGSMSEQRQMLSIVDSRNIKN